MASAALDKLGNHLWYISDELVGMALFDKRVSLELKRKIVDAIKNKAHCNDAVKRVTINTNSEAELKLWRQRNIDELVSMHTMNLFSRFNIDVNFFNLDPSLWESNISYQTARRYLSFLKVTNDCAERAVALVKRFNPSITKKEEQKQYLYQVISEHIKKHPNANKSNL